MCKVTPSPRVAQSVSHFSSQGDDDAFIQALKNALALLILQYTLSIHLHLLHLHFSSSLSLFVLVLWKMKVIMRNLICMFC